MSDLDMLILTAISSAEVSDGKSIDLPAALFGAQRVSRRPPRWSKEEDEFLRRNLGRLSDEQIGQALGRTAVAVNLRWKRELHLPAPSKHPDFLTAHKASKLLGIEKRKVAFWCETGLIPHQLVNGRRMHIISRVTFERWVITPENWIYFDWQKIQDPRLRRLCELRAARWGDEWWTTRQVARYYGVDTKTVTQQINRRTLPAVQCSISRSGRRQRGQERHWTLWYVRKSDAIAAKINRGRGGSRPWRPTPRAQAWMLKAYSMGMPCTGIARSMGGKVTFQTVWNWLKQNYGINKINPEPLTG